MTNFFKVVAVFVVFAVSLQIEAFNQTTTSPLMLELKQNQTPKKSDSDKGERDCKNQRKTLICLEIIQNFRRLFYRVYQNPKLKADRPQNTVGFQ